MAFSITLSILIAVATTAALLVSAVRNRRAGWQRERHDDMLDAMMLWAEAQAAKRIAQQPGNAIASVGDNPSTFTSNLAALQLAVSQPAAIIPAPNSSGRAEATEKATASPTVC